jgi:CelD/BcsL family acetyltransferase involved in cellulose biosynthesis
VLRRPGAWTPFATPQWHRAWERYARRRASAVVLDGPEGEPLAALALASRNGVCTFAGGGLTDYKGPVHAARDEEAAARAVAGRLHATRGRWRVFDTGGLRPGRFAAAFADAAGELGLAVTPRADATTMRLPLPASWDEYLRTLARTARHELRRKLARLEREAPAARVRAATAATLDDDVARFVALHRRAGGTKGRFMTDRAAAFFRDVARASLPDGRLRLHLLEVRGEAVAATFGFQGDGTFYLYNAAHLPEARRLSPGIVLVARLVREAIERGDACFDLLRGTEPYKRDLGARGERLPRFVVRG